MNYSTSLEYLDSFINYERERELAYPEAFKLDRMRALSKELGQPQNSFESVLIAGSKGKGSTASILSSILRMDNWKVGLYTSPHLYDIRERIVVNGLRINELRFIELMGTLKRALDSSEWRKNPPTYFEVLTAMAFEHFKQMKVHVAVLEVGLGGIFDSTNIAPAKVAGLTPISLEHTDKLGKTVSKICVQKCGIIKGREIVVTGIQPAEALTVIENTASEREASLYAVGKDIKILERNFTEDAQRFDVRTPWGNYYDLEIRMRGRHQMENAACAIGLAKALEKKTRLTVSDAAVRQGVLDARWPGRLEKIADHPKIVLDGAHNVDSIGKLVAGLSRHFRYSNLVLIFAAASDKDVEGMFHAIQDECASIILTEIPGPRAMKTAEMRAWVESTARRPILIEADPEKALEKARQIAGPDDLILVTGSLYLVGDIRSRIETGAL